MALETLEMGDVAYYLEDDTIQGVSIISNKLKKKIEESGALWTKDLNVAKEALKTQLYKQADSYIANQMLKFNR